MVGKNHVIANVATAGAGACGLFVISQSNGFLRDVGDRLLQFLVPVDSIGMKLAYCIAGFLFFLLGSLLPDIDSKNSTLGRYVHIPIPHRTLTHTIWIVGLLFALSLKFRIFIWLTLGYALHIFYDGLSSAGIAWFWPLSKYIRYPSGAVIKKGFRFKFYKTGEMSEKIVTICVCCLSLMCIVFTLVHAIV